VDDSYSVFSNFRLSIEPDPSEKTTTSYPDPQISQAPFSSLAPERVGNDRLETRSHERVMRFRAAGDAEMRVLVPHDFGFSFAAGFEFDVAAAGSFG
jgi:hypothetical protein